MPIHVVLTDHCLILSQKALRPGPLLKQLMRLQEEARFLFWVHFEAFLEAGTGICSHVVSISQIMLTQHGILCYNHQYYEDHRLTLPRIS